MEATARDFLSRNNMYYEQMPMEELISLFRQEMQRGLKGQPSSLYMLPTFVRVSGEPVPGEPVLVLDAGGSNLRAARVHFDAAGRPVVDDVRKSRMPGAGQEISADEMFRQMASLALEVCGAAEKACISFSYVFDALPGGDGRILRLCKEVQVRGIEGSPVCAPLEEAMKKLGAPGRRQWKLINDSVGSLLGGMAQCDRSLYDDYIGFILGTGTNSCCALPAARIEKSPEACRMGGDMVVNLESGCFDKLLLGTADRLLDSRSEFPGDHLAEKMIAGGYFPGLLKETLLLASGEGLLSPETAERLAHATMGSRHIDEFCLDPLGPGLIAGAMGSDRERRFAFAVTDMLLERAARITGACLCAILREKGAPAGQRVCVCCDGTTFRKNPLLLPKTRACMERWAPDIRTDFFFVSEATLLGSAWAGLTGQQ